MKIFFIIYFTLSKSPFHLSILLSLRSCYESRVRINMMLTTSYEHSHITVQLMHYESLLCYMAGSPQLAFYATKLREPSHPQDINRFFESVTVQRGSSITLTCTATEPLGFPSSLEPYLRPYVINWFVNSSMVEVSNCDDNPSKTKTCSLSLVNVKPRDDGKYFCQAANQLGCTYKQLLLKVTGGKKLFTFTRPG